FGIKIPREYGGLGLSQLSYMKAIELVSSVDGSLTALLSAHQSIGVPQPLKMFGSDAQKQKYFPRLARGAISAFALTEPGVGSDPAAMETLAVPTQDGPVGGGERAEAGATDAEHRPAHPPHLVGRSREALSRDLAAMGERARAVGPGDREARRDRAEDRRHGREHVRDGGSGGAVRRDGGSRQLRHPARGGDREAVQLRGRVAHHRRDGADPRRPRLRNRGLAAGPGL